MATYVLDGALDPDLAIERTAARCGVIRTSEVSALTTLLLVRFRFDITIKRRSEADFNQLAEDVSLLSFTGLATEPHWLNDEDAERLLGAMPAGNIGPEQRISFVQRIMEERDTLSKHLDSFAIRRAQQLEEQHNRVRSESSSAGRAVVDAHRPVDVLGLYILLPA
jgi:hypothetical protein